jgi:epoxide hydrolase-like predicted phosphatase
MSQDIKAIIFDVGGVILDWETPLNRFCQSIGIDRVRWEEGFAKHRRKAAVGKMTVDEYFKIGLKELGLFKHWRRAREVTPGEFTRIEETFTLIEQLSGRFRLAQLTNAFIGVNAEWDKLHPHRHHFEVIIDSSEVGLAKPDERIYHLVLETLKLSAPQTLFVDDQKENVEAAEKVGMKTVHFTRPKKGVARIKEILGLK